MLRALILGEQDRGHFCFCGLCLWFTELKLFSFH